MRTIANHQTIFLKSPPPYSQTRVQMYKGFGLTGADLQMIHGLRKGLSTCEVWVMGATNHHRHHCHCHQLQTAVTRVLDDLERNKKKENHLNTISKMMGKLVHVQLYTFSYRKAVIQPQNMPKTTDWG